jgi:hypothetical protein
MARPRRSSRSTAPARTTTVARTRVAAAIVDWKRDTTIHRLTSDILSLHRDGARKSSRTIAKIGDRLTRARARLPYGQWIEWVDHRLPYEPKTAQRYMSLAALAKLEPREFARLHHLGPSKLYLIIALEPARRRALQPARTVTLAGIPKTIETMTARELGAHLGFKTDKGAAPPIAKVVQAVASRAGHLDAVLDEMVARKSEVKLAVVRKIRDRVAGVLEKIDTAFGL